MSETSDRALLYIFPPSSGCETIKWLLERYEIPTTINSQTAPFFLFAIHLHGGKDFPFLKYRGKKLSSSREISIELEEMVPDDRKLYPRGPKLDEAKELWTKFLSPKLGGAVPKWAYYYLLPHKNLLYGPLTKGVPAWQKLIVKLFYPIIAWMVGKNLGLTKDPPVGYEATIREVFDRVDGLLSDGREFLVGDRLSLVDIGFAGMAAPAVLEPRYGNGGLLPALEDAPDAMRSVVRELRARPAGKFIEKIYRDYR